MYFAMVDDIVAIYIFDGPGYKLDAHQVILMCVKMTLICPFNQYSSVIIWTRLKRVYNRKPRDGWLGFFSASHR